MENFYKCNFSYSTFRPAKTSYAQIELMHCALTKRSNKATTICYNIMRDKCLTSKLRVIKTIRMSMGLTEYLLERIRNLKIVHLVRDPRGIIKSRTRGDFLREENKEQLLSAREICKTFMADIYAADILKKKFPGRIKRFRYEDIAVNTSRSVQELYNFIGLDVPASMPQWIKNHTSNGEYNGYYGLIRNDSSQIAYQWKTSLSRRRIAETDSICNSFYTIAGYNVYIDITSEKVKHGNNKHSSKSTFNKRFTRFKRKN